MNNGYDFNARHDSHCEGPYCNYSIADIPTAWLYHLLGMGALFKVGPDRLCYNFL